MDINVNIKIDAPELAEAIQSWADTFSLAVRAYAEENGIDFSADEVCEKLVTEAKAKVEEPVEELADEKETPEITLETVRAKLAALSQSGKQTEVKKLITSFKAKKLTEIPQEKYPELLKKAEDI